MTLNPTTTHGEQPFTGNQKVILEKRTPGKRFEQGSIQRLGKIMSKPTTKEPEVFELNREYFIAWTEGILLDFKRGKGIVLDGSEFAKRCEAAEKAMEGGATIFLTDAHGKKITKMFDAGDGYTEEEL